MRRDELAAWLRLAHTPGLNDRAARRLLQAFGLPQQVLAQPAAALEPLIGAELARTLLAPSPIQDALLESTSDWLDDAPAPNLERRILSWSDPDYPPALLETPDPPPLLYVTGARGLRWPTLSRTIAMVGSRHATPPGAQQARRFSQELVTAGWCVVSGMALGIDAEAHEGALRAAADGGPGETRETPVTIAVVGTGVDRIYPARHRELAHRVAQHGLLLSEFPIGAPPLTHHFPRRNRLIAGLSRGTLVVEAALASGSLITARLALELNREVFAMPGPIQSPQSRGCHALIRDGACLVEDVGDILAAFGEGVVERVPPGGSARTAGAPRSAAGDRPRGSPASSAGNDGPLLAALGFEPVGLDELVARTGLPTAELQSRLLELELSGNVARLPGARFQRLVIA